MFSVKNIEYLETRRGVAWSCKITKNGKVVGGCENRGDGGCNTYYWNDKTAQAEFSREASAKHSSVEPEDRYICEIMNKVEGVK